MAIDAQRQGVRSVRRNLRLAFYCLVAGLAGCDAVAVDPEGAWRQVPAAARVNLVVHEGLGPDVLALLESHLSTAERAHARRTLQVSPVMEVAWTAQLEEALSWVPSEWVTVEWVRPNHVCAPAASRPNASFNIDAADTSNVDELQPGGDTGRNLTGAGVVLGQWDDGVARATHVEFGDRVSVLDRASPADHATEVAGTMIAGGVRAAARGMASGARLFAHDWNQDAIEIDAVGHVLAASNHSYGAILGWEDNPACPDLPSWSAGSSFSDPAFGKYGAQASLIDGVLHDRDALAVWAAGNDRDDSGGQEGGDHYHWPDCGRTFRDSHASENLLGYGTIGGQPASKNALVVGATRDITADPPASNSIVVASYSSFGPLDDGRIKPDLVASGDDLDTATGTADDHYAVRQGTSLAAPVVTGALALLVEQYRRAHAGRDPHAAELKALLLHTARRPGSTQGPTYGLGYGLLDARAASDILAIDGASDASLQRLRAGVVADGGVAEFRTDVVAAGTSLRVTIAWHDPAGLPNTLGEDDPTPALVNDLDVVLVAPDGQEIFYPWRLNGAAPGAAATRLTDNAVDNVEMVDVDSGSNVWNGRWTVRVSHKGGLQPRGRAQVFGVASSVPLARASEPLLGMPRRLLVELAYGLTAAAVDVDIVNRGGGQLHWMVTDLAPWIAVDSTVGDAPGVLRMHLDASMFNAPGEHIGWVDINGSDGVGTRRIAIVLRLTCAAQCTGRQCGTDPVCGQSCGRCATGFACGALGQCVAVGAGCPGADLGSHLGVVAEGTTVGQMDSFAGSCGGTSTRDTSFAWTAPATGRYWLSTRGSFFDTVLYVRDGACGGPEIACNDNSGSAASVVAVNLTAGQPIVAVVDGQFAIGSYVLSIERARCVDGDLGRALGDGVLVTSTLGAVDDLQGSCGGGGGQDVAFRWTAPAAGSYRFTTAGSEAGRDTILYVLDGDCDGSELGCADAENVTSAQHAADELTLDLQAEQSVTVVIDAHDERAVGDVRLGIRRMVASCDGICGQSPNGQCFCDAACVAMGDCCVDVCTACGHCDCEADCADAECGSDGCGGSCGGCTTGEICEDGLCVVNLCAGVPCDPCEECVAGGCVARPEFAPCEDGVRCTLGDECIGGVCTGELLSCDDGDACTADGCDEVTGRCEFVPVAECCHADADCGDGDLCTVDTCNVTQQVCLHTTRTECCRTSADCDDEDPCTVNTCLAGQCIANVSSACVPEDAGKIPDAGWADSEVTGGGCSCGVAGANAPVGVGLHLAWVLCAWIARRRIRARSAPASSSRRSRHPR